GQDAAPANGEHAENSAEPSGADEAAAPGEVMIQRYGLRQYMTEVVVKPRSPVVGKTLGESRVGEAVDLEVVGLRRGAERVVAPRPELRLHEGDVLILEGRAEDVLAIKDTAGLEIKADVRLSGADLQSDTVRMVESMVLPRSELIGGSLSDVRFRERTG